jgi:hypothetical protein
MSQCRTRVVSKTNTTPTHVVTLNCVIFSDYLWFLHAGVLLCPVSMHVSVLHTRKLEIYGCSHQREQTWVNQRLVTVGPPSWPLSQTQRNPQTCHWLALKYLMGRGGVFILLNHKRMVIIVYSNDSIIANQFPDFKPI